MNSLVYLNQKPHGEQLCGFLIKLKPTRDLRKKPTIKNGPSFKPSVSIDATQTGSYGEHPF